MSTSSDDTSRTPRLHDGPVVIGIYGLPGCGKTHLKEKLKERLKDHEVAFYDGSEVLSRIVKGGIDTFKKLETDLQSAWRHKAIEMINNECFKNKKTGVVTGHAMFWKEGEKDPAVIYTKKDLDVYTHMIYLKVNPSVIAKRRRNDTEKIRPLDSIGHLEKWQRSESMELRKLCRINKILFTTVSSEKVSKFLCDFRIHNEKMNLSTAENMLDNIMTQSRETPATMLVFDGDGTLTPSDTGIMFFQKISNAQYPNGNQNPLKELFSDSKWGHSYAAFRQATLMYEDAADELNFGALCEKVAMEVKMYPEFVNLLQLVAENRERSVSAIVVTSGLQLVWQKILEKAGLANTVKVIGGGRVANRIVVTAEVKAALVSRLKHSHNIKHVCAFGDSPLDLEMLRKADEAVVVVGDKETRSKSMEAKLGAAIRDEVLKVARQVVLPSSVTPRLDTTKLPLVDITRQDFVDSVFGTNSRFAGLRFYHATEKSSTKLLATLMRDSASAGPALREVHRRCGFYLATKFLGKTDIIGLEECTISHVLGVRAIGYRLLYEQKTLIVALMRGGEPMAFGVNDAFPLAAFKHADATTDLQLEHIQGMYSVILVDCVVNSGSTVIRFVKRVRELNATIRIVVVAGVVQDKCISGESSLINSLAHEKNASLVTLRTSTTKFTGIGTTDTGNRLFNTTHLA
ncbi:uncharacterized protein BDR25DRAFT_382102 [Lindgomyces ingoldianus]|uniref:Uncharacterized protein n=1 Tax=Lindgomyces ingoldianus TaxID=673940 RepID=A0ACB6R7H6_9PLEO|nr:uncharacterized protein BDR25DRAFT_382102 [Lindgomyces ingoldianus]KAF2475228.1 hypothetical protein BDR25DRAFT_382102 [Lindgomyces ingoldianus]